MKDKNLPVSGIGDLTSAAWLVLKTYWAESKLFRGFVVVGGTGLVATSLIYTRPSNQPPIGTTNSVIPIGETQKAALTPKEIAATNLNFSQEKLNTSKAAYASVLPEELARALNARAKQYEGWAIQEATKNQWDLQMAYQKIRQIKLNELKATSKVNNESAAVLFFELLAMQLAENKSLPLGTIKYDEGIAQINVRRIAISLENLQESFLDHARQQDDLMRIIGGQAQAEMNRAAEQPSIQEGGKPNGQ